MLVGKNASGMYVIDEDYKIISYNLAAREIYPAAEEVKMLSLSEKQRNSLWICPVVGTGSRSSIWNRTEYHHVRLMLCGEFRWNPAGQDMPLFFGYKDEWWSQQRNDGESATLGIINVLGKFYQYLLCWQRDS